jgi:hypothetical protein
MAKHHRTALGKTVDMAALRAKNEKTRAIGNMHVNARGDIIDSNNEVINDATKRVNEHYMRGAINRLAQAQARQAREQEEQAERQPIPQPPTAPVITSSQHKNAARIEADVDVDDTLLSQEELEFDKEDAVVAKEIVKEAPKAKK